MELRYVERVEYVPDKNINNYKTVLILQYRDIMLHDWIDVPIVKEDTGMEPRSSSVE